MNGPNYVYIWRTHCSVRCALLGQAKLSISLSDHNEMHRVDYVLSSSIQDRLYNQTLPSLHHTLPCDCHTCRLIPHHHHFWFSFFLLTWVRKIFVWKQGFHWYLKDTKSWRKFFDDMTWFSVLVECDRVLQWFAKGRARPLQDFLNGQIDEKI